jgi:hypothetical protein
VRHFRKADSGKTLRGVWTRGVEPGKNKCARAWLGLAMAWACSTGMACVARGGSACVRGGTGTGQSSSTTWDRTRSLAKLEPPVRQIQHRKATYDAPRVLAPWNLGLRAAQGYDDGAFLTACLAS